MNVTRILRTARITSWTYRLLSTAVGLVTIRLINDRVGIDGYGEVAFVLALLSGIVALDFGFLPALSRFVARYDDERHAERRPRFWAACVLAIAALYVLQVALISGLAAAFGHRPQLDRFDLPELVALGCAMALGNALTASSSVFAGLQHYGFAGAGKIGRSLAYLGVILMLWAVDDLTVRSVLWSYTCTLLFANATVALLMFSVLRERLSWSWLDFPAAHAAEIRTIADYSLRGWMFTLATIVVSSGSVVAAGLFLSAAEVAKLQVALVLYTGVVAFVTGSMIPLSTITARSDDGSIEGARRIADAALKLIDETLVFAAALLVFFIHHGPTVLGILIGANDATLVASTQRIVVAAVLPGLAVLPFFVFRFAMVSDRGNAVFSRRTLVGTVLLLALGLLGAWFGHGLLPLAVAVGAAVAWRGVLAYVMGRRILPGVTLWRMLAPLVLLVLIFEILSLATAALHAPVTGLTEERAHAVAYVILCILVYMQRRRLQRLIGTRLGPGALTS